ncbi:MAG: LuxR family transcriptional regulator [Dehalococcoidia bacterium]|nr:MAG: LuxR family transcriptional regulator [Dehalococcoidia bacterium]
MVAQPTRQDDSLRLDSAAAVFAVDLDQRIVSSTPAATAILGGRPITGLRCYDVMCALDPRNSAQCRPDCLEVTDARCGRTPRGSSLWGAACKQSRPVTTVIEEREGIPPLIIHILSDTEGPVIPGGAYVPSQELTRRQVESLRLLAQGLSPCEISRALGISPVTVRNHIQSAMERLDAHTRLEAVLLATRAGLI